jgi:flagellar hook-associated protein 2
VEALGTGQTLTSATGLKLEVTGGATGIRGSVLFSRGIADQIDTVLTGMLASEGLLASKTESLTSRVADITQQREAHERRMALVEQRYVAQFTAMDTLIAKLNSTGSYLTQQLASLANLSSSGGE